MGSMLLMCQNTRMRIYGAQIKRYCVLCSKHIAVRVVLSSRWFATSRLVAPVSVRLVIKSVLCNHPENNFTRNETTLLKSLTHLSGANELSPWVTRTYVPWSVDTVYSVVCRELVPVNVTHILQPHNSPRARKVILESMSKIITCIHC